MEICVISATRAWVRSGTDVAWVAPSVFQFTYGTGALSCWDMYRLHPLVLLKGNGDAFCNGLKNNLKNLACGVYSRVTTNFRPYSIWNKKKYEIVFCLQALEFHYFSDGHATKNMESAHLPALKASPWLKAYCQYWKQYTVESTNNQHSLHKHEISIHTETSITSMITCLMSRLYYKTPALQMSAVAVEMIRYSTFM